MTTTETTRATTTQPVPTTRPVPTTQPVWTTTPKPPTRMPPTPMPPPALAGPPDATDRAEWLDVSEGPVAPEVPFASDASDASGVPDLLVPQARAARELELRRDEFRLAVDLGIVRTVPWPPPGTVEVDGGPARRRRVPRAEIERLRAAPDFPEGLRERVRAVGTAEGAELLAVTRDRFARLARTGHFSPVRFYVNRYRAVVWLYPAAELAEFALNHPRLLTGRLPLDVRTRADDSRQDWRPRNWRARRLGALLRATGNPWVRTAAIASLLDPAHVAEVVDDPYERVYLDRLRPAPPVWRPNGPAAREIADRLILADDPDEILWHRMSLALALDEARAEREAPRPGMPSAAASPTALRPLTPAFTASTATSPGEHRPR
ncbi:DUF6397 family protein [Streptomyces roseicoloratus]|uniref:DUF6397 family protein n=1 Tax=Streptomyces roseicoloratus TaxID=2508722 RepID=A0ABY9RND0_9ACTN|nr:DUF6397 family protein [Streptomyces roseicoloratus]WMX43690.1 DUF6397 family protein [Streptomyces roseicoloratus]